MMFTPTIWDGIWKSAKIIKGYFSNFDFFFYPTIQYPVFYYRLIAEPNSEESNASSEAE